MNNKTHATPKHTLSLDAVQRPAPQPTSKPTAAAKRPTAQRRTYRAPRQPESKPSKTWQQAQLPLLVTAGVAGGFLVQNLAIGLAMLAVYSLAVFVKRIASRTTFTLALLLLAAISLMLLFKPETQLIRNFATYAFVLMLVGVITLAREARMPEYARPKYKR